MNHPDDQDVDPEDIFVEIEPTEPASLDARIRVGEEVDPDELEDDDWDSQQGHLEHLADLKHLKADKEGSPGQA